MRKWMRYLVYLVVIAGNGWLHAGSYDDFFAAIKQDNPRSVLALLQRGFDPNTVNPEGLHGLYLALREPSPKVAELLIDWPKTQVEYRSPADESALMMACLHGHLELARKLIARDADVNKPGWTPLHYAATNGHLAIMELLLEHHAFVDPQSPNGTTPLMMAAHYGTPAAVKLLLDSGADTRMKNQLGMSAVDFAYRGNRADAAKLILDHIRAAEQKIKP